MSSKVVAIVQARMGSSRLPGKVLLELAGDCMLGRVVARARRAKTVHEVLVATTTEDADDAIAAYCARRQIPCCRGSQFDVLDRYHRAASSAEAGVVVRITADCPVIDPVLIDAVVDTLAGRHGLETRQNRSLGLLEGLSFAANRLPPPWKRSYPIGLDTEACTFAALEAAWQQADEPAQREHVMPYLYEGVRLTRIDPRVSTGVGARGFRVAILDCELPLGDYRWTVDTPEDLEFMRRVYGQFGGRDDFSWMDVFALVQRQPELKGINAGVPHKSLGETDARAPGTRPQ